MFASGVLLGSLLTIIAAMFLGIDKHGSAFAGRLWT